MDPTTGGIWAVAIAIFAHGVAWFFKTPKETAGEMSRRVEDLSVKHHALDMRFVAAEARLSSELRHLANTIERLIDIMQNGNGHERNSGRHLNIG